MMEHGLLEGYLEELGDGSDGLVRLQHQLFVEHFEAGVLSLEITLLDELLRCLTPLGKRVCVTIQVPTTYKFQKKNESYNSERRNYFQQRAIIDYNLFILSRKILSL